MDFAAEFFQASSASKASVILSLIRLHTCLSNRQPLPVVLDFNEAEGEAIFSVCSTLINEESEFKQAILSGLLSGQGDFNGVSCKSISRTQQPRIKLTV
jgi:hypothetical protein